MNNKVIQSLWIGGSLTNNELLCANSFIYHQHEFHLYTYNEIANIPAGVIVKDGNEIIPSTAIFKDSHNTYASFADWFRLKLLFQKGGWWVDMDTVCLRSFDIPDAHCYSSEWEFSMKGTEVNNTFIKSPAGDPRLKELIGHIEEMIDSGEPVQWGEAGVYLFRKFFSCHADMLKYIKAPEVFCPLNYFDLSGLICKNNYSPNPETLAIHLWNEIWRRGNLDKNSTYHPDSIYEILKRKYLS